MKLKKFVAAAAAAVMSLAMLTACSGGGSGPAPSDTGYTRKTIEVETEKGEVSDSMAKIEYYTTNGKWIYTKTETAGDVEESLIDPDGRWYDVDTTSEPWTAYYDGALTDELKPFDIKQAESRDTYKGRDYRIVINTYVYADKTDIKTYYYDDAGLQYIKEATVRGQKETYTMKKVLIDKASVDEENRAKLDIDNYRKEIGE